MIFEVLLVSWYADLGGVSMIIRVYTLRGVSMIIRVYTLRGVSMIIRVYTLRGVSMIIRVYTLRSVSMIIRVDFGIAFCVCLVHWNERLYVYLLGVSILLFDFGIFPI